MSDDLPPFVTEASGPPPSAPAFSLCTLVTDAALYTRMCESFVAAGFDPADCQYLCLDNREQNQLDAYQGLARLIARARGRHVLLLHQDVLAIDGRAVLEARLAELDRLAPLWAVAGNAGYDADRHKHVRITHRFGIDLRIGTLPAEVVSLDENLLILRHVALVAPSADVRGFHLYGTDLATQARLSGFSAHVIDYHLEHLGHGRVDAGFVAALDTFEAKYARALRRRSVRTPVTKVGLGRRDMEARLRRWRMVRQVESGRKPFSWAKRFDYHRRKLWFDLRDLIRGPRYHLDGIRLTIPRGAPPQLRKGLLRGSYEGPERRLVARHLPTDLPAVELGGAYGVVTNAIRRRLSPRVPVVTVEANPDLMPVLTANASAGASAGEVVAVNAAVAHDGAETVRFTLTEGVHSSHLGEGAAGEGGRVIEAPAVTLAGLLATHGIDGPFSLVCDIEGAELSLLRNEADTLARCACLIVELHPPAFIDAGASVSEVRAMIEALGLEIVSTEAMTLAALRR